MATSIFCVLSVLPLWPDGTKTLIYKARFFARRSKITETVTEIIQLCACAARSHMVSRWAILADVELTLIDRWLHGTSASVTPQLLRWLSSSTSHKPWRHLTYFRFRSAGAPSSVTYARRQLWRHRVWRYNPLLWQPHYARTLSWEMVLFIV